MSCEHIESDVATLVPDSNSGNYEIINSNSQDLYMHVKLTEIFLVILSMVKRSSAGSPRSFPVRSLACVDCMVQPLYMYHFFIRDPQLAQSEVEKYLKFMTVTALTCTDSLTTRQQKVYMAGV